MGRTDSEAPGYAPEIVQDEVDLFDPLADDFVSKERKYLHFDRALSESDRGQVRATDAAILSRSFWPLLAFTKLERRIRRDEDKIFFEDKKREIKFGSHADAALLEAYARRLAISYEASLKDLGLSDCVLAYRQNCGDNISQAKLLFDQIRSKSEVVAIGIDIRKFFDRINHEVLLKNLRIVLKSHRLPAPDYKIFTRMTAFEWVESDKISGALTGIKTPRGRICDAAQFRKVIRSSKKLIQSNKDAFGIPQGTPLSGLYANISLLEFDKDMSFLAQQLGGVYRRYSDDIAFLVPEPADPDEVLAKISSYLSAVDLKVADDKTIISRFSVVAGKLISDKIFQYLGFTFDGQKILIRQSSINRYYTKMNFGIKSKVRAAKQGGVPRNTMFMRQLFKTYTHFGRHRNFPRYAYRASRIMDSPDIKRQLRNHMKIFKKLIERHLDAAY